ncbi:GntR family transcriptional regulator [Roseateles noduli]|nr:GntR family transcriptional regulator [Roseateles noduli]
MLPWITDTSPDLLADVRDTSLAKLVRDEVLNAILRGDLPPGQRINEPDVAARLRVSRVPVREALRELESTGLVAARKHAGVFVRVLQPKEVANLYELRSLLDGHAGRRAAALDRPRRDALVKRLVTLGREMKADARRRDVQAYYAANLAFHWAIVEATDNEPLTRTYQGIVQQLHLSRLRNLSRDVGMKVSIEEHDQIVAALDDGDAALCQRLQEHHVNAAHGRLLETEGKTGGDHPGHSAGQGSADGMS